MNKEQLKKIIVEQKETIRSKFKTKNIIKRDIKSSLENTNQILVITGIRRAGKSTLTHLLLKNKSYSYINFDDERLIDFNLKDFDKLLEAFYELFGKIEWIIFDEIQNIEKWELFITRLKEKYNIIITGSNSKLLSSELSTHLTGRHKDITLFPFSFKEFLRFRNFDNYNIYLSEDISKIKSFLKEYFQRGGFPDADEKGIVSTIYDDIINKDIIFRKNIRYKKIFKEFSKIIVSNFSNKINLSTLRKQIDIKSENTLKNYLDFLEEAFIILPLKKFSFKIKEQSKEKKKIYIIDTGVIKEIAFQFTNNVGRIYENLVAIELFKNRGRNNIFYYETKDNYEIDFVIKEGNQVTKLIQVTAINERHELSPREIRALLHAQKELKCSNLTIITDDYESEEKVEWFGMKGEIKFIPLWKWLIK